jgi:hypothetical protein
MGSNKRKDRTLQAEYEAATQYISDHITDKCQQIEFDKLIIEGRVVDIAARCKEYGFCTMEWRRYACPCSTYRD